MHRAASITNSPCSGPLRTVQYTCMPNGIGLMVSGRFLARKCGACGAVSARRIVYRSGNLLAGVAPAVPPSGLFLRRSNEAWIDYSVRFCRCRHQAGGIFFAFLDNVTIGPATAKFDGGPPSFFARCKILRHQFGASAKAPLDIATTSVAPHAHTKSAHVQPPRYQVVLRVPVASRSTHLPVAPGKTGRCTENECRASPSVYRSPSRASLNPFKSVSECGRVATQHEIVIDISIDCAGTCAFPTHADGT